MTVFIDQLASKFNRRPHKKRHRSYVSFRRRDRLPMEAYPFANDDLADRILKQPG
jgi:hypothetical protein